MKPIYFDNNATTCIAPEVAEVILPFLHEKYYNPSSMYPQALEVSQQIKKARHEVASLLGSIEPCQIFFTSGATESNNWAIKGCVKANRKRKHIITSVVEHPAVLEVCKEMQRQGCEVTFIPVDSSGNIDINSYVRALRKDTLLVSIMHANNETGVIFPIAKLARIAKDTNPQILFHTDATQTLGKLPIDLDIEYSNVDLLSFSGHKIHALKGIGALYLKRGTPCSPLLSGGHQESGLRAGTENVIGIISLAKACLLAKDNLSQECKIRELRDILEQQVKERIPYVEINGKDAPRLSNTLNIACHYVEGESLLFGLSEKGVCVSSGSACTSGSLEPSHVLKAMNIPFTAMHGSIRFSLSRYNTEEEVRYVSKVFPEIVSNLRRISPYWNQSTNSPRTST